MEMETRCGRALDSYIDRRTLRRAAVSVFLWGALTYFYAFLNFPVSHDSLREFVSDYRWKIGLGRFLEPIYQELVRGRLAVFWPIGLLALGFIALAVYALARMMGMNAAWQVALTAGIVVTMPSTFLNAATYIHDFDSKMLALLFAVLSVWAWRTGKKRFLPLGCGMVVAVMGLYQSYLSIAVTGVMILSLLDLLEGTPAKGVLCRGLTAIGMVAAGLLLYGLLVQAACRVTHVTLDEQNYNSVTNIFSPKTMESLGTNLVSSYRDVWRVLTVGHFGYGGRLSPVQCAVFAGALAALVYRAVSARLNATSLLLIAALLAAFPLGMNLSMVANAGYVHDLMRCGIISAYLLALLIVAPLCACRKRIIRRFAALVLACLAWTLWQNAIDANQCFIKKELGRQATASIMTNVSYEMERQEGYVPGETPVFFTETPPVEPDLPKTMQYLSEYTGVWSGEQIRTLEQYDYYFKYVLQRSVLQCSYAQKVELMQSGQVLDMPAYPQNGYVQMVDGVLVVKMR